MKTLLLTIIVAAVVSGCEVIDVDGKSAYGPAPVSLSGGHASLLFCKNKDATCKAIFTDGGTLQGRNESVFGDDLLAAMAYSEMQYTEAELIARKRAVIGILIAQSEAICSAYFTDVVAVRNTVSSGLEFATKALAAASGLATPNRSANILGAVSGLSLQTKEILETNILGEKDLQLITQAARNERARIRNSLITALKGDGVSTTPFGVLYADVQRFHDACGINRGLEKLIAEAQQTIESEKKKLEKETENVLTGKSKDPAKPAKPKKS